MEILYLLLGTGQNILRDFDLREYKTAKYCLKSDITRGAVESPFVGEAIVKLNHGRFSKIYIFGTNNSMWETLYMHISQNETNPEKLLEIKKNFVLIWKAIDKKNIDTQPEIINILNNALSNYFEIPTECIIVPTGESDDELWKIFDTLLSIPHQAAIISFDITHGLRYHPYFFLISLFYLNSISNGTVKIGSIFYGALELQKETEYNGIAPIFEFTIFSEMIKWVNAAEMFRKYKDPDALADLLSKQETTKELAELIKKYSFAYNANNYFDIIKLSNDLVEKIQIPLNKPQPFKFIAPKLKENALEINALETDTLKLMKIAQQQLRAHNYTEAVLAMYEAIVEEYRSQKGVKDKFDAHEQFTKDLKNLRDKLTTNQIKNFYKNTMQLKKIRNKLAHLNEENDISIDLQIIRDLVNYFSGNIERVRFS